MQEPGPGVGLGQAEVDVELGEERVLTGLGPLRTASQITIKQKLQTCEILTGCEQENRFQVAGPGGDIIYWAKEQSHFCSRYSTLPRMTL